MTAYDDYPTALCLLCGTSMHHYPAQIRAHEDKHHSMDNPASYRLFDQRGDVPQEIESAEAFYANTKETK